MVRSAGTSGGPSKKKKRPLPARSNAASSLEESRQRCKVSTFGSSGLRTNSGLCRGLKSLHFGAESTRSRTAILSATCPVVCCAMLGCVQFGSVVWRVTRAIINIRTSMDRKQNSEFI